MRSAVQARLSLRRRKQRVAFSSFFADEISRFAQTRSTFAEKNRLVGRIGKLVVYLRRNLYALSSNRWHEENRNPMERNRYVFNQETLQYEKRQESALARWGRLGLHLLISASVGLGLMLLYSSIFSTPRSHALQREGNDLQMQIAMLQNQVNSSMQQLGELEKRDNNIYRVIFESDSIPSTVRLGGVGGVDHYEIFKQLEDAEGITRLAKSLDQLSWRSYIQSKSYDEVSKWANDKDLLMRSMPAIQPISITSNHQITSVYGFRTDPFTKRRRMHTGVDFKGALNTPIHSTGDGIVVAAAHSASGYGNQVIVDHGFGYMTRYAHMNKLLVKEGDRVKRGQLVGLMGSTGRSTGVHLHYEVFFKNARVNPMLYFTDMTEETYENVVQQTEAHPALD